MASRQTQRRLYDELVARYGQQIADAFMEAIADLKARSDLAGVIKAIEQGNLEAAINALNLDPAAFGDMLDKITAAYNEGGRVEVGGLPTIRDYSGARVIVRFDGRNLRGEASIRDHGAQLVTRTLEEARAAVRQRLAAGLQRGDNPRQTALDVVGRVSRVTGKREGGILGLTGPQETYVASARAELASADPVALKNYLDRARRDRRFDRSVTKAIREAKPMAPEIVAKAVVAYERRLLKHRGDVIGLQETFNALAIAKEESYRQLIERGTVTAGQVSKGWRHLPSEHPRVQHIAMQGKRVGIDEVFILPDGTAMRFPHDPSAPARHTIGCKCDTDYRVDFLAGLR